MTHTWVDRSGWLARAFALSWHWEAVSGSGRVIASIIAVHGSYSLYVKVPRCSAHGASSWNTLGQAKAQAERCLAGECEK